VVLDLKDLRCRYVPAGVCSNAISNRSMSLRVGCQAAQEFQLLTVHSSRQLQSNGRSFREALRQEGELTSVNRWPQVQVPVTSKDKVFRLLARFMLTVLCCNRVREQCYELRAEVASLSWMKYLAHFGIEFVTLHSVFS
jgi:hypothetical protein